VKSSSAKAISVATTTITNNNGVLPLSEREEEKRYKDGGDRHTIILYNITITE